jgi:hypothetical protein
LGSLVTSHACQASWCLHEPWFVSIPNEYYVTWSNMVKVDSSSLIPLNSSLHDIPWVYLNVNSSSTPPTYEMQPRLPEEEPDATCYVADPGEHNGELKWPNSLDGPTFELKSPHQPRNNPAWWDCEKYWDPLFAPLMYGVISSLPEVVIPHFSTTTANLVAGQSAKPNSLLTPHITDLQQYIPLALQTATPHELEPANSNFEGTLRTVQEGHPNRARPTSPDLPTATGNVLQDTSYRATIILASVSMTAVKSASQENTVRLGSIALSVGGAAYTSAGHIISLASAGIVLDGTTTIPFTPVATHEHSAANIGVSVSAAVPFILAEEASSLSRLTTSGAPEMTLKAQPSPTAIAKKSLGISTLSWKSSSLFVFGLFLVVVL